MLKVKIKKLQKNKLSKYKKFIPVNTPLINNLDALAVSEEEDALEQDASGVKITGTDFGQDKETQITTFVTGQQLTFIRNVSSTSRLDLDTSNSYTIVLIQNGVTNTIKVNGGSDSIIQITQSL